MLMPSGTAGGGVVKGRRATAYPALKADLVNAGAEWVGECKVDGAVRDGNLVTGCTWLGHPALLKEFLALLGTKIQL